MSKSIRLTFHNGESGWATQVAEKRARIDSVPFEGQLNCGDVVQLVSQGDGMIPRAGRVLERRYGLRSVVCYEHLADFKKLTRLFKVEGWAFEGGVGPQKGKPGFMVLAHNRDGCSPLRVASEGGVTVTLRTEDLGPEGKLA